MYVLSFETFMGMRCVQSHQALLSAKLLVEFQPEKEMLGLHSTSVSPTLNCKTAASDLFFSKRSGSG